MNGPFYVTTGYIVMYVIYLMPRTFNGTSINRTTVTRRTDRVVSSPLHATHPMPCLKLRPDFILVDGDSYARLPYDERQRVRVSLGQRRKAKES